MTEKGYSSKGYECLAPLSIFQLYRGCHFVGSGKRSTQK